MLTTYSKLKIWHLLNKIIMMAFIKLVFCTKASTVPVNPSENWALIFSSQREAFSIVL